MLDGVGPNLGANDGLDRVEEVGIGNAAKDGWPGPEGGVGINARLGQGEIEVLGVDLAAIDDDLRQALAKGQVVVRGCDLAGLVEFASKVVEDAVVFVDNGLDDLVHIEHPPH